MDAASLYNGFIIGEYFSNNKINFASLSIKSSFLRISFMSYPMSKYAFLFY